MGKVGDGPTGSRRSRGGYRSGEADVVLAAAFDRIHRLIGAFDERFSVVAVVRVEADADAGADLALFAGHRDRLGDGRKQAAAEDLNGGVLADIGEQDGEFAATEARHPVAVAHGIAQPRRDCFEHLVARGVAEAVVDGIEAVQVRCRPPKPGAGSTIPSDHNHGSGDVPPLRDGAPMDDYDRLFYQSLCLPRTHPDHLAALGRLMGLSAAEPYGCRVLELGCAAGGNLIPMACRLPQARFVGVDLSAAQIGAGQRLVGTLGLDNIELRVADIAMLDDGIGEFDYVIAHGVYSWVPEAVRAGLLRLARRVLAPDGLCYISFNTLPGWRMRGMLRDILCDACRGVTEPPARLAAAQAALVRLEQALPELPGLAADYLRAEIAALRGLHPSYLYFEYLAKHNRAFLFRDFLADIEAQGLRYLCDADLQRQFPASLGDAVDSALADLTDGADVEQWLDFVGTRNFRESLLMRDDARCDEQLSLERFAGLCFSADRATASDVGPAQRCRSDFPAAGRGVGRCATSAEQGAASRVGRTLSGCTAAIAAVASSAAPGAGRRRWSCRRGRCAACGIVRPVRARQLACPSASAAVCRGYCAAAGCDRAGPRPGRERAGSGRDHRSR